MYAYKLVVLLSALAAAAAGPGAVFSSPLIYPHAVLSPATTTITRSASSVVHPSPVVYSTPLAYAHFIKKRSAVLAPVSAYLAPTAYAAYVHPGRLAVAHPLQSAAVIAPAPAPYAYTTHFIKKRSAGVAVFAPASSVSHQSRLDIHSVPSAVTTFTAPLTYATPISYSHFF